MNLALVQSMRVAIKYVATCQPGGLQRGTAGARPLHRVHGKRQVHFQRQSQVGRCGGGVGLRHPAAVVNEQVSGRHLAESKFTVQQRVQRPGDLDIAHLHAEFTALPAQPADAAATPQRASHLPGLQRLTRGQVTRELTQGSGQ